jgi:hypothetical protein
MLRRISSSILGPDKQVRSRSVSQASTQLHVSESPVRSLSGSPSQTISEPSSTASPVANHQLASDLEALQSTARLDFDARKRLLASILELLVSNDGKTAFAESGGFLAYISLLASLELPLDAADFDAQSTERLAIVRLVFETLALSFHNHASNRRMFAHSVGFTAIVDAIRLSNLVAPDAKQRPALFGLLWAFLLNDFSDETRSYFSLALGDTSLQEGGTSERPSISGKTAENPGIALVLLDLVREQSGDNGEDAHRLNLLVVSSLEELAGSSLRNKVMLSEAGTLRSCLISLWPPSSSDHPTGEMRQMLLRLARALFESRVSISEAKMLFRQLVSADKGLDDEVLGLL